MAPNDKTRQPAKAPAHDKTQNPAKREYEHPDITDNRQVWEVLEDAEDR